MTNILKYSRRQTTEVHVGKVVIGGNNPIRIQSMANTDTNDIEASAQQCKRIADVGGEIVRFTAQGQKEANNLQFIEKRLAELGCDVPLVADIHFNPAAADVAAQYVEKVRINPGNYVDSVHTQKRFEYTDEEYAAELQKIRNRFVPFLNICKEHNTAIRIGVNHGSLSDRILSRYGDTSNGMVESCLEFLRICKSENFNDVVISIKASNVIIMVQTVRLLVERMEKEDLHYPIHLGVTEAGAGEDGRVKSAAGIGALLYDGIGDTIRVSLSEDPEAEIPVAKSLANYINSKVAKKAITGNGYPLKDICKLEARKVGRCGIIGGGKVPVVISEYAEVDGLKPDFVSRDKYDASCSVAQIVPFANWKSETNCYPLFSANEISKIGDVNAEYKFLQLSYEEASEEALKNIADDVVLIIKSDSDMNDVACRRNIFVMLTSLGKSNPVILESSYATSDCGELQVCAGADNGLFFIDHLPSGICIKSKLKESLSVAFGILQATRTRVVKTEYISCPSCGRTLYDLQSTLAKIKAKTSHLTGLKIGVMGCIVNGPGEMADADYGYVGSARGKVNLYKKQECVEKLIPEDEAVDKLIELIKKNGDWRNA
ncbi:MAG: (E)-4-hydroxy-3-methylbut-2-enyl-diphosphate synthase [Paludibacteraceae bacterium]|nr:(E)-4-hydroxy-3-methylbut-2-enyl-diphosphate synthase [Paludibacteraceae bacterium]